MASPWNFHFDGGNLRPSYKVLQQELHLNINREQQRIEGWTALTVTVPKSCQSIGLHCVDLIINKVSVDGVEVKQHTAGNPAVEGTPVEKKNEPDASTQKSSQTAAAGEASWNLRTDGRPSNVVSAIQAVTAFGHPPLPSLADQLYRYYRRTVQEEEDIRHLWIPVPPILSEANPVPVPDLGGKGGDDVAMTDLCERSGKVAKEASEHAQTPTLPEPAATTISDTRSICVKIWFERQGSSASAMFTDHVFLTDLQLRRARNLFPCLDTLSSWIPFDIHITCSPTETAVCCGDLVGSVLSLSETPPKAPDQSKDSDLSSALGTVKISDAGCPLSRTFHFKVRCTMRPSDLTIVVGQLEIIPGYRPLGGGGLASQLMSAAHLTCCTAMGPPAAAAELRHTMKYFYLPFDLYEKYLECRFPFEQLHIVFVDADALTPIEVPSLSATPDGAPGRMGPGIMVASSSLLLSGREVEGGIETRLQLALGLAAQWFGALMVPEEPSDAWLLEGLASHLQFQFMRQWLGAAEAAYRRHKMREALVIADNGCMPPLSMKPGQTGSSAAFATQVLEAGELRQWKATAVVSMIEKHIGEDHFKRLLDSLVTNAFASLSKTGSGLDVRKLSTRSFMEEVANMRGSKADTSAFADRWIYGRGVPRVSLKFDFKGGLLDLRIRQSGTSLVDRIKVLVHETESMNEVEVKLDESSKTRDHKERVEVKSKAPRKNKRGAGDVAAEERLPVNYVRLDPGGEWLLEAKVEQPEWMWVSQLEVSLDVVAQSEAVSALARCEMPTDTIMSTLTAVLNDHNVFCRIRAEAAAALARQSSEINNHQGISALCNYFISTMFNPATKTPRPNYFADLAEYTVLEAVPPALAAIVPLEGYSHPGAVKLCLDYLEYRDNKGNPFDDSMLTAAFITALGSMCPTSMLLGPICDQIDRYLELEEACSSSGNVVGCACLRSSAELALRLRGSNDAVTAAVRVAAAQLMASYAAYKPADVSRLLEHIPGAISPNASIPARGGVWHPKSAALRHTAQQCLLKLAAVIGGVSGLVGCVAGIVEIEPIEALRTTALWTAVDCVGHIDEDADWKLEGLVVKPLVDLVIGPLGSSGARLRHAAFMLLQRLGGKEPMLWREPSEEDADRVTGEVSGGTVVSTATAAGQRRTKPLRIKLNAKLLLPTAAGAADTPSGGRPLAVTSEPGSGLGTAPRLTGSHMSQDPLTPTQSLPAGTAAHRIHSAPALQLPQASGREPSSPTTSYPAPALHPTTLPSGGAITPSSHGLERFPGTQEVVTPGASTRTEKVQGAITPGVRTQVEKTQGGIITPGASVQTQKPQETSTPGVSAQTERGRGVVTPGVSAQAERRSTSEADLAHSREKLHGSYSGLAVLAAEPEVSESTYSVSVVQPPETVPALFVPSTTATLAATVESTIVSSAEQPPRQQLPSTSLDLSGISLLPESTAISQTQPPAAAIVQPVSEVPASLSQEPCSSGPVNAAPVKTEGALKYKFKYGGKILKAGQTSDSVAIKREESLPLPAAQVQGERAEQIKSEPAIQIKSEPAVRIKSEPLELPSLVTPTPTGAEVKLEPQTSVGLVQPTSGRITKIKLKVKLPLSSTPPPLAPTRTNTPPPIPDTLTHSRLTPEIVDEAASEGRLRRHSSRMSLDGGPTMSHNSGQSNAYREDSEGNASKRRRRDRG